MQSLRVREAELIGRLGDSEHQVLQLSSKALTVELSCAAVQADSDSWQTRCCLAEAEVETLRMTVATAQRTALVLQGEKAECDRALLELQNRFDAGSVREQELLDGLEQRDERLRVLKDQLSVEQEARLADQANLKDEVTGLVDEQRRMREEIETAFASAEQELRACELVRDSLQSELESTKDFLESEKAAHDKEAVRLRQALEMAREQLSQYYRDSEVEGAKLTAQLAQQREECSQLAAQIASQATQAKEMIADLERSEGQKRETELVVECLRQELESEKAALSVAIQARESLDVESKTLLDENQALLDRTSKVVIRYACFLVS